MSDNNKQKKELSKEEEVKDLSKKTKTLKDDELWTTYYN